jgi:DNA polymerase V
MDPKETGIAVFEAKQKLERPIYLASVAAGFPSPAGDYIDKKLDLNELLIKHPAATFFVRAKGDSMAGAGIRSGDILIVDRALEPGDGRIVIAAVEGDLTVKRIRKKDGKLFLEPENDQFQPIEITADRSLLVWGVVTHVIHKA